MASPCPDDNPAFQIDGSGEQCEQSDKSYNQLPTSDRLKLSTALPRLDSLDMESNRVSGLMHQGEKVLATSVILRLAYESIGVVYGDVGTSPLYVYSSTFPNGLDPINYKNDVLGALSLIIYTLTMIPLIKYVFIVLRANDNGDGGTFALYSLLCRHAKISLMANQQIEDRELSAYKLELPSRQLKRALKVKELLEGGRISRTILLIVSLLGTCLVIGDGVLTPSISVLSAVGGIQQAASGFHQSAVVGISVVILILLFMVQRFGTSKVGFMFAPAVLLWFSFIGTIGLYNIFKYEPGVFEAFNPMHLYRYLERNKKDGWVSLGGIVLAITGTEAMFADMGHFSLRSIQIAFSFLVYPCLLCAYIGQASYLLKNPSDVDDTFYKSIPGPLYWPMFVVAVAAAVIASQAMISATFTVVKQSMSLGCFPRVKVVHTSSKVAGQVYIPEMNWLLMIGCVFVTLLFQSTTNLGNAYGIAVVGVMSVTTFLVFLIMIMIWQVHILLALSFLVVFGSVDLLYFSAVLYKFDKGGYLPLAFSAGLLFVMYVWQYVTALRYRYELQHKMSLEALSQQMQKVSRVPGIALVYSELAQGIPGIFSHLLENLPAIHSVVVFVCVKFLPVTTVMDEERFLIRRVGTASFHTYRCVARYGYKDIRKESDRFEQELLAELARFITSEQQGRSLSSCRLEGKPAVESHARISSGSIHPERQSSHGSESPEPEVKNEEEEEEEKDELEFLFESKDEGVVYMLGQSDVRADSSSSLVKRMVVNYAYDFLRRNCRKGSVALIVPHQRLLEVGMIYHI